METRTKPQEVDKEETEEDLLYYSDNSEEIDPRDAYREILRKKVNRRIFQEKAVTCFLYIPENFYYGNRYYKTDLFRLKMNYFVQSFLTL